MAMTWKTGIRNLEVYLAYRRRKIAAREARKANKAAAKLAPQPSSAQIQDAGESSKACLAELAKG